MKNKKPLIVEPTPIQEAVEGTCKQAPIDTMPPVKSRVTRLCEDCRVENAFQSWRSQHLTPSFNWNINFTETVNIPDGKRAVIELITATIQVPSGERARLRMYTSLDFNPSNLDFTLTSQGEVGSREILVGTYSVRVYSDHHIAFNVNRDNAQTEGDAIICISGYLIDV
jgi:hypothetical protein